MVALKDLEVAPGEGLKVVGRVEEEKGFPLVHLCTPKDKKRNL